MILDCINVILDGQCQCIVSHEDFQHKILNCSLSSHSFSPRRSGTDRNRWKLWELSINLESAILEVLYKNSCAEKFGKFSRKHLWWGSVLMKLQNENCNFTKILLILGCFPGNLPKFSERLFCTWAIPL